MITVDTFRPRIYRVELHPAAGLDDGADGDPSSLLRHYRIPGQHGHVYRFDGRRLGACLDQPIGYGTVARMCRLVDANPGLMTIEDRDGEPEFVFAPGLLIAVGEILRLDFRGPVRAR